MLLKKGSGFLIQVMIVGDHRLFKMFHLISRHSLFVLQEVVNEVDNACILAKNLLMLLISIVL